MFKEKKIRIVCRLTSIYVIATFILISLSFLSSSMIVSPQSSLMKAAYADGLFQEQLSASFADRKADLIIKMTPPVVTNETLQTQSQKPVIQFKLYDPATKEGFKHVTYFITIEKNGKKLLSDWFHDHKGDLKIEMKPSNIERVTVYGEPDPILQAFTGTKNSPVIATGPIFSEGGLYHFIVRITTIDYDRSLIPDDKQPVYDGWLSVGSTQNEQVSMGDGGKQQIPIQIISYYDELQDFSFDPTKKQMQFTMPFDWNVTRLEKNNVMVHQEVSIPKQSELDSRSYAGTVNGVDVTNNLMVDPSNSTKNIVHFMLPKPVVIQIAQQVNKNGGQTASDELMEFALKPSENVTSSAMSSMSGMSEM
jgi:hypothetical protein